MSQNMINIDSPCGEMYVLNYDLIDNDRKLNVLPVVQCYIWPYKTTTRCPIIVDLAHHLCKCQNDKNDIS